MCSQWSLKTFDISTYIKFSLKSLIHYVRRSATIHIPPHTQTYKRIYTHSIARKYPLGGAQNIFLEIYILAITYMTRSENGILFKKNNFNSAK